MERRYFGHSQLTGLFGVRLIRKGEKPGSANWAKYHLQVLDGYGDFRAPVSADREGGRHELTHSYNCAQNM